MSAQGPHAWMRRAIGLAVAQLGRTGQNPSVGCVIVSGGDVVGEGATGDGGRPHAEEIALAAAGASALGAVAYVTLEPCGERSSGGRSCAQRLVEGRVAQVIVAASDQSPYALGRGLTRLREAGVPVEVGFLGTEAEDALYRDYRP